MTQLLTRDQELLRLKVAEMSPAMQEDFAKGNLNFSDSVYYKRFEVTNAGGLLDILQNDDAIRDGYCNISKQKIRQGCTIMVNRITVRGGYVATGGTETAADIVYLPIADIATVSPVFANCELEFDVAQQNLFQAPINSFTQESIGVNGSKDGIILTAPKMVTDSQEMQFRLHVPQSKSIDGTTNRFFIEVALRGSEIRVK